MADKEIPPYRCTYCLHALPEDTHQDIFGVELLTPKSDDAINFVTEAQKILRYASAVSLMCHSAQKVGEDVRYEFHQLLNELTDEVNRRLERAHDALEIVEDREEAAKKKA